MKVIFLDVDGVLVTRRCVAAPFAAPLAAPFAAPFVAFQQTHSSGTHRPNALGPRDTGASHELTRTVHPSHSPSHPVPPGPASRRIRWSRTSARSSNGRARTSCSAPTGVDVHWPATNAPGSSRDTASRCSTGPPSTARRTRSIARRRYSRGSRTTTRTRAPSAPRRWTSRPTVTPQPFPTRPRR